MRTRQDGHHLADDIFKCIFLNENVWIPIKISLKFVPKDPINNIPALVQIMSWRRPGDKPLSESMMVSLLMHICVTQPQWVKGTHNKQSNIIIYTSRSEVKVRPTWPPNDKKYDWYTLWKITKCWWFWTSNFDLLNIVLNWFAMMVKASYCL